MSKWMTCILADDDTDTAAVSLFECVFTTALKHIACATEGLLMALLAALYLIPKAYEMRGYWAIGGEWLGIMMIFCTTYYLQYRFLKEE